MKPKASVSITTYNHEKYIAQAIDSVLMQETDFDYEIIIGEDDSSDQTRAIVQTYQQKYPDKIRLFLNNRDDVIYIDGNPTGRWNLVNNLKHTQGEYVALLDGDDYWIDPLKLQKQVNYLDSHPECSQCFHPIIEINEISGTQRISATHLTKDMYSIEDLIRNPFIATCSVMFRNSLFGRIPDWFFETPTGDWPLHILNAQFGRIGFIREAMSVYRIHPGGIWSSRDTNFKKTRTFRTLNILKTHLDPKYAPLFQQSILEHHVKQLRRAMLDKKYRQMVVLIIDFAKDKNLPKTQLLKTFASLTLAKMQRTS